jgi:hypothetical protein
MQSIVEREERGETVEDRIIDPELAAAKMTGYYGSGYDLPLYFDLLLFYLRIQADAYASLGSFLYPPRDKGRIDDGSFREHRKWFTGKHQKDYPEYASILKTHNNGSIRYPAKSRRDFVMSWFIIVASRNIAGRSRAQTLRGSFVEASIGAMALVKKTYSKRSAE